MIGKDSIDYYHARDLFETVFDNEGRKVADKLEIMSAMCLVSSLSSEAKVKYLFDLFDLNKKGFLIESEISLLIKTVTDAAFKIDSTLSHPSNESIRRLVIEALYYAEGGSNEVRKFDLLSYSSYTAEVRAFLEVWRGHASQVLLQSNEKVFSILFITYCYHLELVVLLTSFDIPFPCLVRAQIMDFLLVIYFF